MSVKSIPADFEYIGILNEDKIYVRPVTGRYFNHETNEFQDGFQVLGIWTKGEYIIWDQVHSTREDANTLDICRDTFNAHTFSYEM